MKIAGALCLCLAAGVLGPQAAQANCRVPDAKLLWTFPADGAVDVPTNAVIWVHSTLSDYPTTVTVDGRAITPHALPHAFEPGPLAPNQRHEVVVTHQMPAPVELRFGFVTGAGPVQAPRPPESQGVVRLLDQRSLSSACHAVLHDGACYDTGQNTHLMVETSARPLVWLIQTVPTRAGETPATSLWPAACDSPEVFTHRQSSHCYNLISANEVGDAVSSGPFCPPSTPVASREAGGCGVAPVQASRSGGAAGIVMMLGLFTAFKRRHRR